MFRLIGPKPRRKLDPDIARAVALPVDEALQKRAVQLIRKGEIERAIDEVRAGARYDRRDARSVVLALMYGVKVPTVKP
jgi:2-phosphoglycerate kinase